MLSYLARTRILVGIVVLLVLASSFAGIYFLQLFMSAWTSPKNEMSYKVQPGDSLYDIGFRFGVSWETLALTNNIPPPYTIQVGEVLSIPLKESTCSLITSGVNESESYKPQTEKIASPVKYVMIRFDDSYQDQWFYALPILEEYGFRAAFATVAGLVLTVPICGIADGWEKMNWPEIQWLYANGNEISDHTMTHAHLDKLSASELTYQIVGSKQMLESYGINYIPSLTLPFGQGVDNSTVVSEITSAGFKHIYPDEQTDGFAITNYTTLQTGWYSIDALDNQSLARFENLSQSASSQFVVGFIFHHVDDHVTDTGYYVNVTNFAQDMKYLYDDGYTVILPQNLPGY